MRQEVVHSRARNRGASIGSSRRRRAMYDTIVRALAMMILGGLIELVGVGDIGGVRVERASAFDGGVSLIG